MTGKKGLLEFWATVCCTNGGTERVRRRRMQKWRCTICQYIYDPAEGDPGDGISPGTSFEELPDEWVCPLCGAGKELFEPA